MSNIENILQLKTMSSISSLVNELKSCVNVKFSFASKDQLSQRVILIQLMNVFSAGTDDKYFHTYFPVYTNIEHPRILSISEIIVLKPI